MCDLGLRIVDVPEDDAAAVRSLLDNDTDVEPGGLVIISIDDASTRGEVSLVDGVVRYGPAGAFNALAEGEEAFDSFSYTVVDAQGETDMATATVRVIGANDAPQTTPGSLQFDENDGEQLVDLTPDDDAALARSEAAAARATAAARTRRRARRSRKDSSCARCRTRQSAATARRAKNRGIISRSV